MKKKLFLLFGLMGLLCLTAQAIPADPTPASVTQPDGSTLTVTLHGDEFFHFTTTSDGYTVLKNQAGYYTYARLDGDRLVPSNRIARDAGHRTAEDLAFLAMTPKRLTDNAKVQNGQHKLSRRNSAMRRVGADGRMDYDNFRGLIILVNYSDKQFSMNNPGTFYNNMVNAHNYTGYTLNGRRVSMTGSVRDYYYDNSSHFFDPVFDVVGPVDVNYACTYPQSTAHADDVFHAALRAADADINYQDYDSDGDGYVDMVFFLVAGLSANYSGNNDDYLWPHMYYLYGAPFLDGVGFGLYACSTEIAGWEGSWSDINGIGTFCHEFGHVLGLPDLYDTDYSGSGGESRNPGNWSIMAGGSGSNYGRNPVGYSLYERYALGFTHPQLITEEGQYSIQALDECNMGYRLNTPTEDEYSLIENRQAGKWDKNLPGHGMLVARVDSTNERIWWSNEVNCNPSRMYFELLRASYSGQDSGSDPFPGTQRVTEINNFTSPALVTWDNKFNDFGIYDITEQGKIISFNVERDTSILSIIEGFEQMPVTSDLNAKNVAGVYSKWDFVKCAVQQADVTQCNGLQAVGMKKPSQITTSAPLNIIPYMMEYTVFNPTSTDAKFRFYYSVDNGETWTPHADGVLDVDARSHATASVKLPIDQPIMLRFAMTSGSAKTNCYIDDIKLYYKDTWGPIYVTGDVNLDGEVNVSDVNTIIDVILGGNDVNGRADVNDDGEINIADINMIISTIVNN